MKFFPIFKYNCRWILISRIDEIFFNEIIFYSVIKFLILSGDEIIISIWNLFYVWDETFSKRRRNILFKCYDYFEMKLFCKMKYFKKWNVIF